MKKVICVLLAVLLLSSLSAVAFAEVTSEFTENGITVTLPDLNLKGYMEEAPQGAVCDDPNVCLIAYYYVAIPTEEIMGIADRLNNGEATEEDLMALQEKGGQIVWVVSTETGLEETCALLGLTEEDDLTELSSAEGYDFYFVDLGDKSFLENADREFAEEAEEIVATLLEAYRSAEFYAPFNKLDELVGSTIHFESKDIDGNDLTSEALFAENEITMVNIWGTWCHFCVEEMAELAEIHTRLREKGCGIVGIEYEYDTDETIMQLARDIMAEKGTNYPNVMYSEDMSFLNAVTGFPTSFFVDRNGTVLCTPISGAAVDEYEKTIDALLAGEAVAGYAEPAAAANDANVFRVIVTDGEGPVEGVTVQFCDETTCNMGKTDKDGVASFAMPEGVIYTVHILKVPEGYEKLPDEFQTLDVYSDLSIVINRAA